MKTDVQISGNRLRLTRTFQAPRPVVFSWWSEAEKLQQWSSCREAVSCRVEMDFRVGGSFTQQMTIAVHGQTCDFSMTGTYEEIAVPEKIVYRADFGLVATRVTAEFFEQGEATKVVVTHEGLPDASFGANVSQGTSESFEKLDALLASQAVVTGL
jgi:uncharacterized protein YndB with AHSA1/START domain